MDVICQNQKSFHLILVHEADVLTRHHRALTTIQTKMMKLKPPFVNVFVCIFVFR